MLRTIREAAREAGTQIKFVCEDMEFAAENGRITIFHPDLRESGNNGGLCVLASHEKYDILITGDLSQNAEYRLLSRYDLRDIELLIERRHFCRPGQFLRTPGSRHPCAHSKYRRGNLPDG